MTRYYCDGMPMNSKCDICGKDIWVREGVYTNYHGKAHGKPNQVMSRSTLVEKLSGHKSGAVCVECWEKNYEQAD